jgi:fatty acid desaturase
MKSRCYLALFLRLRARRAIDRQVFILIPSRAHTHTHNFFFILSLLLLLFTILAVLFGVATYTFLLFHFFSSLPFWVEEASFYEELEHSSVHAERNERAGIM